MQAFLSTAAPGVCTILLHEIGVAAAEEGARKG